MPNAFFVDITGQKFGKLKVLYRTDNDKHDNAVWVCECECGNLTKAKGYHLRNGTTLSCGCLCAEVHTERLSTHKLSKTRIYRIWSLMKDRCQNPKSHAYSRYGGRGIKVCDKWQTFEGFYEDMGPTYKDGLTLDRKNNDSDYCKENCRWAAVLTQANNTRCNRVETVNGATGTLAELCRHFGLPYKAVHHRLSRGMTIEDAFNKPFRKSPTTKRAN